MTVLARMRIVASALAALSLLAACASSPGALPPPPPTQAPPPSAPRFDDAIAAFEAADKQTPPAKCATLFVGSSTIRFWTTLARDFPTRTVINRGFGGSTIWEIDAYFDRIVTPYRPKQIVFYAGDNDIALGRSAFEAYADFAAFMAMKDKALGTTPVWFIAVKPSKLRWEMQPQMADLNARVKALADKRNDLAYIDIVPAMLGKDGKPKDIFKEDRLHMTAEGYKLWTPIVNAALDKGQAAKAPGCP